MGDADGITLRGRPPRFPFSRAATTFAADLDLPPIVPPQASQGGGHADNGDPPGSFLWVALAECRACAGS